MTNPDNNAEFTAFLAWKAKQANPQTRDVFPDEVPDPTITDVLCMLVRSARLPNESTVLLYEKVVTEFFANASVPADDTDHGYVPSVDAFGNVDYPPSDPRYPTHANPGHVPIVGTVSAPSVDAFGHVTSDAAA